MNTHRRYQYILTPDGPRRGITRTVAQIEQDGRCLRGVTTIDGQQVRVSSTMGRVWEVYGESREGTSGADSQSIQAESVGMAVMGEGLAASKRTAMPEVWGNGSHQSAGSKPRMPKVQGGDSADVGTL